MPLSMRPPISFLKRNQSKQLKRGQGTLEYLLLIAVVAAVIFIFNKLGSPQINSVMQTIVGDIENNSWRGGVASHRNFYGRRHGVSAQ